ncbi:MAG: acetyltransferase [Flavobacteriales bacterium]|nr:acetyltransferase [Flavobacteriales bacterium]
MKKIVLFGAGLHANYSIDILERMNEYEIVGIIDSVNEIGSEKFGYPIIGRQEDLVNIVEKHQIEGGFISIGDNYSRKIVHDCIIGMIPNFEFVNAIHPSTLIGKNVKIGKGILTMAGSIISTSCTVGDFTFLATGAQLEHDSIMEDYSSLSCGSLTGGKVVIGKYTAITLGVVLIDRIKIGENTVVGSGSLVTKDLPDNVLAYGSPCQIVRKRELNDKFLKSN